LIKQEKTLKCEVSKMKGATNKKITASLAIALTFSIASWGTTEKASAQTIGDALNLITTPFNAIFNRQSEQPTNRSIGVFNSNLNGNTFNICVLPSCRIPTTSVNPVSVAPQPQRIAPTATRFSATSLPNTIPSTVAPTQPTPRAISF
jgi:hypothetical protein